MNPLKIEQAILCDYIRLEANNKHTLLGVYGPEIILGDIPGNILISIFLQCTLTAVGEFKGQIRFLENDSPNPFFVEFGVEGRGIGSMNIGFGPFPLNITAIGSSKFEWRFETADDWTEVISFTVSHDPNLGHAQK